MNIFHLVSHTRVWNELVRGKKKIEHHKERYHMRDLATRDAAAVDFNAVATEYFAWYEEFNLRVFNTRTPYSSVYIYIYHRHGLIILKSLPFVWISIILSIDRVTQKYSVIVIV